MSKTFDTRTVAEDEENRSGHPLYLSRFITSGILFMPNHLLITRRECSEAVALNAGRLYVSILLKVGTFA